MKTYQDFESVGESEKAIVEFVLSAIREHKADPDYQLAVIADDYDRQQNTTIRLYVKMLRNRMGLPVPDIYSPNHKIYSNFFNRFITQENQYLLGNGLIFKNETRKAKLGLDIDQRIQELGRNALKEKVSFGFWNLDHLEVFKLTEFCPLVDEETGAIRAGIRFWQLADDKPLRATLYEESGFTEIIKRQNEDGKFLHEKRAYQQVMKKGGLDDGKIMEGKNYPSFPIIPMWGNPLHQSELKGMRDSIDAYDIIKSGFANDLDRELVFWILTNTGGIDNDVDFAIFMERIRAMGGGALDDEVKVDMKEINVPYESRVAYLERMERDMYGDFQALDVSLLQGGNKTATEINAAYTPLDLKCDQFEFCVLDFLTELFKLVGIEELPTFKRNRIKNEMEETQMVMLAAEHLDEATILKKLPFLTFEEVERVLEAKAAEDLNRIE